MNCRWLQNDKLRDIIFKSLLDESILPIPLNIQQFVMETDEMFYANNEQELLEVVKAKSRDTVESFAEEIKLMKGYKILFLSFPFISEYFSVDFVEDKYQKLAKELKNEGIINEYIIDFKSVLDSFRNNKINIFYDKIKFSHPSYFEAFQRAISTKGVSTQIGEILGAVLLKIDDNKEVSFAVAKTVASNFDKLPENVQDLLFKLADNRDTADCIVDAIANHCYNLPVNVQNLLFKVVDYGDESLAYSVADAVASNFDKLPANVQNLLFKLVDSKDAAFIAAYAIASNFDKLPANVQNLLFRLSENSDAALYVAYAVSDNFDKLPADVRNELLVKLADSNNKYVKLNRGK
jgi:hypothetical protein